MDLLGASYRNMPEIWDQEVNQPRHAVSLKDENLMFPTMPMFNRSENFTHFDLDTLFFTFYYQQGTYQ
jgi:CCR4-NOT transcriptional regulation complex NOT5 subunit